MRSVLACFLVVMLAVPSALANGASPFFTSVPGLETDFLTVMSTVWNNFALPVSAPFPTSSKPSAASASRHASTSYTFTFSSVMCSPAPPGPNRSV